MHPSHKYRNDRREDAEAFIAAHPFALLATNGSDGPLTALVPLVLDPATETLIGHVARANPFWSRVETGGSKAVAIFRGADTYISPSYYASKVEHGRVVPTWNYLAVEVRGGMIIETRSQAMRPYLENLTDVMESHRDVPWTISDAPEDYISKLSRAIVGIRLSVDEVAFVRKLSQDKTDQDRKGVMAGLAHENSPQAQAIAEIMCGDDEAGYS